MDDTEERLPAEEIAALIRGELDSYQPERLRAWLPDWTGLMRAELGSYRTTRLPATFRQVLERTPKRVWAPHVNWQPTLALAMVFLIVLAFSRASVQPGGFGGTLQRVGLTKLMPAATPTPEQHQTQSPSTIPPRQHGAGGGPTPQQPPAQPPPSEPANPGGGEQPKPTPGGGGGGQQPPGNPVPQPQPPPPPVPVPQPPPLPQPIPTLVPTPLPIPTLPIPTPTPICVPLPGIPCPP